MTPALELRELRKSFGGLPAMNGVSLEVMPGERRLIIGPNGAGKTTLFNLITGDLKRDAGAIRLFGDEVSRLKPHERAHRGLARTYQIITLFPKDSLEHNLVLSLLGLSKSRWDVFRPLARYAGLNEESRRVLKRVGLEHLAKRSIGEWGFSIRRCRSGGGQARAMSPIWATWSGRCGGAAMATSPTRLRALASA